MPVENSDRRRRQYVPLVSTFAHGRTANNLLGKFGRDGLLVWVCYLAACKRAPEQGVFEYTSEPEGWQLLGLHGIEPDFTLAEFFKYTGRLHKTSTRRARNEPRTSRARATDELQTVACTVWDDIQAGYDRELDAARKRRKRGGKTPDDLPTDDGLNSGRSTDDAGTEGEAELEVEKKSARTNLKRATKWVDTVGWQYEPIDLTAELAKLRLSDVDRAGLMELAATKVVAHAARNGERTT